MEILVKETTGLLHSAGKEGVTSLAEVSHQKAYVLREVLHHTDAHALG